jgi:hypothetical protein
MNKYLLSSFLLAATFGAKAMDESSSSPVLDQRITLPSQEILKERLLQACFYDFTETTKIDAKLAEQKLSPLEKSVKWLNA